MRFATIRSFAAAGLVLGVGVVPAQPPGGVRPQVKLVKQFDKNGDNRLDAVERKAAREYLATQPQQGRGFGGRGFGRGGSQTPPEPGPKVSPAEVKRYTTEPLYDEKVVRTLFLEFENPDWEKELAAFYHTDVEVPAKLTVDGKVYPDVGVHFRGASSFMMVPEGRKRSLNLTMDFAHDDQRLLGYRTLNLLNANGDPTMMRAVLYTHVARQYIPAPKANHVRVVINGESWGVYMNVQQYNSEFTSEWFNSKKGTRWKVPGSPNGRGGLAYLGEDVEAYKRLYEIKTKDDPKAWAAFVNLCKVLDQTPPEKLEAALKPMLDIEGTLKFLALDKTFINNDGYWIRASDYAIYLDEKGVFHLIPHDTNETFAPAENMGRGGRGGPGRGFPPGFPGGFDGPPPGGRGPDGPPPFGPPPGGPGGPPREEKADLDPFTPADDPNKPLISKLLKAPELRARYLGYMKEMAETWLDWKKIGPIAEAAHAQIAPYVKTDTRKLDTTEAFEKGLTEDVAGQGFGPPGPRMSLKNFVEKRREYLLSHPEIQKVSARK